LVNVVPESKTQAENPPAKQNAAGHIQQLLDQAGGASMKDSRASPLR
jgi:hypothetical protein